MNSIARSVLPQPAPPHKSVGRPLGNPPPVISSSPGTPVGALGNCGLELCSGADFRDARDLGLSLVTIASSIESGESEWLKCGCLFDKNGGSKWIELTPAPDISAVAVENPKIGFDCRHWRCSRNLLVTLEADHPSGIAGRAREEAASLETALAAILRSLSGYQILFYCLCMCGREHKSPLLWRNKLFNQR